MEIKYYNREAQQLETEKVYGEAMVKWFYQSNAGKLIQPIATSTWFSKLYGSFQNTSISKAKIDPFIRDFNINMEEFLPQEGRSEHDPYDSFNQFFIRRFKEGKRTFSSQPDILSAPCEARYFGYESIDDNIVIPVKGVNLKPQAMIENEKWGEYFDGGPLLIARLCPVDYHRYHFPDSGKILDSYRRGNILHSVNPIALGEKPEIFLINEREVSILETKHFGKMAYIEVGAICVGRIVQSHQGETFQRGEEKGYFLFGGSTVVLIGEKRKWKPSADILEQTSKGVETYLKLGDEVGRCL